jgi:hypothetical protein
MIKSKKKTEEEIVEDCEDEEYDKMENFNDVCF